MASKSPPTRDKLYPHCRAKNTKNSSSSSLYSTISEQSQNYSPNNNNNNTIYEPNSGKLFNARIKI